MISQELEDKNKLYEILGHPLQTLARENCAIVLFLNQSMKPHLQELQMGDTSGKRQILLEDVKHLGQIERHYIRINDLIMPHIVTQVGVAPKKVMMGIQDDVLRMIRDLRDDLLSPESDSNGLMDFAIFLIRDIEIIIRQEREVYTSEVIRFISEEQWREIAKAEKAYPYCMIEPPAEWLLEE